MLCFPGAFRISENNEYKKSECSSLRRKFSSKFKILDEHDNNVNSNQMSLKGMFDILGEIMLKLREI